MSMVMSATPSERSDVLRSLVKLGESKVAARVIDMSICEEPGGFGIQSPKLTLVNRKGHCIRLNQQLMDLLPDRSRMFPFHQTFSLNSKKSKNEAE